VNSPVSLSANTVADVESAAFPERLLDSPVVDAFALRPPSVVTRARQAAILAWGFGYVGAGKSFLSLGFHRHSVLLGVIGAAVFAAGTRILLNAVPSRHRS
jgi:hypothetical protein